MVTYLNIGLYQGFLFEHILWYGYFWMLGLYLHDKYLITWTQNDHGYLFEHTVTIPWLLIWTHCYTMFTYLNTLLYHGYLFEHTVIPWLLIWTHCNTLWLLIWTHCYTMVTYLNPLLYHGYLFEPTVIPWLLIWTHWYTMVTYLNTEWPKLLEHKSKLSQGLLYWARNFVKCNSLFIELLIKE